MSRLSFLPVCFFLCCLSLNYESRGEDWSQWRGPERTGISNETGLLKKWPADGPKQVWQVDNVGVGYSSVVVVRDRIYTQGDLNGVEHTICLDAKNGKVIWAKQPAPVAKALEDKIATEFAVADTNSDGIVSEVEAWRKLGSGFLKYDATTDRPAEAVAKARAATMFAELDADKDGQISASEAGSLLRDEFPKVDAADSAADVDALAKDRTLTLMKQLDADADSQISKKEAKGSTLDRSFRRIDRKEPGTDKGDDQVTPAELERYFAKQEAGKDGLLTLAELSNYYEKYHPGKDGKLTKDELQGFYGGYRNGQGDGPRGTPNVQGDHVYVEGGNGDVTCFHAATGETIWHVQLVSELGGGRPGWGYSESPLLEGDLLLVTPGGKEGTLAALNKNTGEVIWRSEDLVEGAHYSSPIATNIGGRREFVQFARESVFGVDAKTGELLWQYDGANNGTANCFTPIVADDQVFVSSAYGTGSGLAKVTTTGKKQSADEVYFMKKLASHHGGAVKIGDYLYSNGGGTLICMNFETGDIAWQDRSVGKGSLIAVDGLLYVQSERYEMALVEATPEEYRELGRFQFTGHGRPSWAHPVVANGRLYIRDQESLTAYELTP